jgi:tRNA 2-selenouridine synthase
VNEYGSSDQQEFLDAMTRISKKLGGQHFNAAKERLMQGDMASTIDLLLVYYDKAYTKALEKKKSRIKLLIPWDGREINNYVSALVDEVNALPAEV